MVLRKLVCKMIMIPQIFRVIKPNRIYDKRDNMMYDVVFYYVLMFILD